MSNLAVKRISASPDPVPSMRTSPEYAKLVDISRCIGCKGCEVACKEWNDLKVEPTVNFGSYQSHQDLSSNTWLLMRFNEVEAEGGLRWLITKDACHHCEEPGCLYACPSPGAIVQYENGIVDFDQDHCIGCQYCVAGCPFDIPRFDAASKKVYKCNMCIDRVEAGLEPACVKTCPTNAISWGTKEDMLALAEQKVERLEKRGFAHAALYNPEGVGGTHMMYVVPHGDQLEDYHLPADPVASPGSLHPWFGIVFAVSVVLMLFLWLKDMRFGKADGEWLRAVKHYARHDRERVPPTGKYNGGQKLFFWLQFLLGIVLLATGVPLWLPESFGAGLLATMRFLHYFATLGAGLLLIVHVYLGTIAYPGTARSMLYGTVSRAWARLHHPLWHEQETKP